MQEANTQSLKECCGQAELSAIREKMLSRETISELAAMYKAIGDETRVKLILALLQSELCVHDLAELLEMGQSAISHQLRYLRNLRIVKRRKAGKTVFYSLDDHHVEQIFALTMQHLGHR